MRFGLRSLLLPPMSFSTSSSSVEPGVLVRSGLLLLILLQCARLRLLGRPVTRESVADWSCCNLQLLLRNPAPPRSLHLPLTGMPAALSPSLCQWPMPSAMLLLLLLLVLQLSQGEEQKKPAQDGEVNVLVYGTLQLGQALMDTYTSTSDKLQRIAGRHGKLEKKMERLQAEVSRASSERRRIGEEVERLQREEHERRSLSHRTAENLQGAQKEYAELQRRVHDLEKGVQAKEQLLPSFLKKRVEQRDLILQVLLEESARQKKQMAEQRTRLLTILEQASAIGSS